MSYYPQVLTDVVAGLTYKPGTRFDVWCEGIQNEIIRVGISREVEDSEHPGLRTLFMQSAAFSPVLLDSMGPRAGAYIRDRIVSLIHEMELHEADEWLRYNGQLVNDPHERKLNALDD